MKFNLLGFIGLRAGCVILRRPSRKGRERFMSRTDIGNMEFYKYQGAGNDFLIADNRSGAVSLSPEEISRLCDRRYGVGADGLMLLENSPEHDFRMVYFNSDGSGGMMCGNGGRCIVAFAADMGYSNFDFEAPDGVHCARILASSGHCRTVSLKMKDVTGIRMIDGNSYFLDTGTRHYVHFVPDVAECDVVGEGRRIRNLPEFAPVGTNVNFVSVMPSGMSDGLRSIMVRTYEKGVEDETFACGTGIVASAIASFCHCYEGHRPEAIVRYEVFAKKDRLAVGFVPSLCGNEENCRFSDIWLTGPAVYVAKVSV